MGAASVDGGRSAVSGRIMRAGKRIGVAALVALLIVTGALAPGPELTSSASRQAEANRAAQSAVGPQGPNPPDGHVGDGYDWARGPSPDPGFFPLAVWLQSPSNAAAYKAIGINTFIGLWQGPTHAQLDALSESGMPVMAHQNSVGLERVDAPVIVGWTQQDEPDNAQPDGQGGYGPCVDPQVIIDRYEAMRAADPSRPVFLNLGQNVAWDFDDPYVGRGSACADRWDQYPEYVQGADIVSFDIYPVTSPYDEIQGKLWLVARGVDRLREWSKGEKIVWNVIETTHIKSNVMPTPKQVEAQVWMSLIHGSQGIVYFAHEWEPTFREAALLHYPEMREAVAAINAQILELAPVLNRPSEAGLVSVNSLRPEVPVDVAVKRLDGATYVFAAAMRDDNTTAEFSVADGGTGQVQVLGEDRTILMRSGVFRDDFKGYEVHRYRIEGPKATYLPRVSGRTASDQR